MQHCYKCGRPRPKPGSAAKKGKKRKRHGRAQPPTKQQRNNKALATIAKLLKQSGHR